MIDVSTGAAERRAWVRYATNQPTECAPVVETDGPQWVGKVRDISAGGLGVVLDRRFEPGTVLLVGVEDKAEASYRALLARVVRVTRFPDGNWLLGCIFARNLTEEDVAALL